MEQNARIDALDGWRGIAILLVLFDHIQDSLLGRYMFPWTQTGIRGVNLFFILSGFLITSRLLESYDLRAFYTRRFFRLMPVAWLYLAALLLVHGTTAKEAFLCVIFLRNFWGFIGLAGHFWSLSIEEQFYLIWPTVLFLSGRRRATWIAAVGAAVCGLLRVALWKHDQAILPAKPTWSWADGLMIGCLIALVMAEPSMRARFMRIARFGIWPSVLIYTAFAYLYPHGEAQIIEDVCAGLWIAYCSVHPVQILSSRLLAWLGRISYSIYVWQGVFMGLRKAVFFVTVMPAVAVVSYYLLEKPMIAIGKRLTQPIAAPAPAKA